MAIPAYIWSKELETRIANLEGRISFLDDRVKTLEKEVKELRLESLPPPPKSKARHSSKSK